MGHQGFPPGFFCPKTFPGPGDDDGGLLTLVDVDAYSGFAHTGCHLMIDQNEKDQWNQSSQWNQWNQ